ncbi:uncharacterized protein Z520_07160 [Fonsecaea multimorphosa CBS 102226]|uniref:Uncharacterized protein n=1 Tax=Fonsecaea multimorphosa CBS 102226 TaxID=1442371 RepID=A0A0D2IJ28_9EURO|nr:uncharacterized protein Z520_07160 [Fonsecaea multimorphosa CBS 102226]KIX97046.1 hypothetical protein Z520_07160 [Fonsecaea multimorphosa CBS 102226]OAL22822.1 hypothetical protein AYO22_06730 [Fonsecaea multimorphosa]
MNRQNLIKNDRDSYYASRYEDAEVVTVLFDQDDYHDNDDDDEQLPAYYAGPRKYLASLAVPVVLFVVFLTLLLVCAAAVLLTMRTIAISSSDSGVGGFAAAGPEVLDCGESPEEAVTRGCRFDVMSFTWSPAPCFDEALVTEFLESAPSSPGYWQWWTGTNLTTATALGLGDVQGGTFPQLYVTNEYHQYHCMYMYKKLHRALRAGAGYLDSYIGSYEHTLHCEHILLSRDFNPDRVETTIRRKFVTCGRISS